MFMTRFIDRPQDQDRQALVRLPQQMEAGLFHGWGPKF
jgi:hypothetical protein